MVSNLTGARIMPNPTLTEEQRQNLFRPLFHKLKAELNELAAGDPALLFALRRKLVKELGYLEKGPPAHRKKLKATMWKKQNGLCALCGKDMPEKGSELDRFEAIYGYTEANVRLVHRKCHIADQESKGYA